MEQVTFSVEALFGGMFLLIGTFVSVYMKRQYATQKRIFKLIERLEDDLRKQALLIAKIEVSIKKNGV